MITLRSGNCKEVLLNLEVGAIICDPPYGLEFMGRDWDRLDGVGAGMQAWHFEWLSVAFGSLRPGGVIKAFGGTRTFHRLAAAMECAGFTDIHLEAWGYGSGFPKSMDVSKQLDKRPGIRCHAAFAAELKAKRLAKGYTNTFDVAERIVGHRTGAVANWEKFQWPEAKWWPKIQEVIGMDPTWEAILAIADRKVGNSTNTTCSWFPAPCQGHACGTLYETRHQLPTLPTTAQAKLWDGWGTALKPAWEPVVVGRKPQ